MNLLKLKIVLMCFSFFCVGFVLASLDVLKLEFCHIRVAKEEQLKSNQLIDDSSSDQTITSGPLRVGDEDINKH